jgi:hypothetical protein
MQTEHEGSVSTCIHLMAYINLYTTTEIFSPMKLFGNGYVINEYLILTNNDSWNVVPLVENPILKWVSSSST